MESKKVVQHVYLVGAKSIYRVAEKDKEYLRDEEEKNQNTACGASCWRRGSLHPNASQVFGFAILKFIIKYTPYAFYFTLNSVELNEIVASQSSILFFGVSTIIGYYYYSKEKEIDTKTQLLYNMQIISLSIALMTAFVPLINRVLYYGMAYELLYLPNMLKLINNRREKMLVKVFLILMYGGITAYGMINSGWYTCIPYNFYFDYR